MNLTLDFEKYHRSLEQSRLIHSRGRVNRVVGLLLEGRGPSLCVGDVCRICTRDRKSTVLAEVVGFRDDNILLMPLGDIRGVGPGSDLLVTGDVASVGVGEKLLGRVVDAFGQPIDHKGPISFEHRRPLHQSPPSPMKRARIREPLATGVRAIDGVLTCGKGQRVGLFAGSGVGKSVLMGMIARNTSAQINVIALIGERGREIREFIEESLGEEGLKHSVVVAVPSDQPPMARMYGALAATSIAEYFRDQGADVFLMVDSATRVAMAGREIGLAVGEPPTVKGYTPSVFAFLPKLLERAGTSDAGSVTGFYTVLVEGDDMDDPIADTMRSILDGHIVLSRKIAARNHFPAIDVLPSISRLMTDVATTEHKALASKLRETLAVYAEAEDLISVGAYVKGAQPRVDEAVKRIDAANKFLKQGMSESSSIDKTVSDMKALFS